MENLNNQPGKKFPWGWVAAGCGVFTILLAASAVVIILVVAPAVKNALANQGPLLSPLSTPRIGSTAVPNPGAGKGATIGDLPFKFSAIQDPTTMSSQSLMEQMVTSLNLNNDTDFMAPKSYEGSASLDPSTGFTLGNGWCAKDSTTLQQNLANIKYQLSINGNNIDLSQYPMLFSTDSRGESCAESGVLVTPSGTLSGAYHFILTQTFVNSLDDGITPSPYPAGDVKFDFSIQFKATPRPGSST